MRPPTLALLLASVLFVGYLLAATDGVLSWSDGDAGASGAIPIHLRKCTPDLNSHVVTGLAPGTKYAFQAIGEYGTGDPKDDLGSILFFTTSSARVARDDQVVTLPAAILTTTSVTLRGGYSPATTGGDELEKFAFVYVKGDHMDSMDLRQVSGATDTGTLGIISTIFSFTVPGISPGDEYTVQAIGKRVSGVGWEVVAKPLKFHTADKLDEDLETVPALPSANPTSSWTLQMSTTTTGKAREFKDYLFVYNLASRLAADTKDIRTTQTFTSINKGNAGNGFKYCKVNVGGCGGCHGDWEAMKAQRGSEQPVIDRISGEVWVNGEQNKWQYDFSSPGKPKTYAIDIYLNTKRAPGFYNKVAFDLNASAGSFELYSGEDALRITGGTFQHYGSKNPGACIKDPRDPTATCHRYGATPDDEKNWTGELTNTLKGGNSSRSGAGYDIITSKGYHFRAKWVAPPKQEPHGVAFKMAFMIPNGDGIDSCVYVIDSSGCNSTKGYSDQESWDWWSFMIPFKIMCETGQTQAVCFQRVEAFVIPPAPPLNTQGTNPAGGDGGGGRVTPTLPGEAWVALGTAGLIWTRRRRS